METGNPIATQCDLLAADPYDESAARRGWELTRSTLRGRKQSAGRQARQIRGTCAPPTSSPAIYSDAKRDAEFLPLARAAAEQGVAEAYSLIGYTLDAKKDARSRRAYQAAAQRSVIESFPILYPFLARHAVTDRDRLGLAWDAEEAAALGVPEAHLALAEATRDPVARRCTSASPPGFGCRRAIGSPPRRC